MKLLSITATFGRLDNETLHLTDGLNIFHLPNEGGKSTWSAFLQVMLYGLDTRKRDRKGAPAWKNRYRPWSGKPMEGELLLEHQGKTLRLRRWTEGSVPLGGFSLTGAESGLPVRGITALNAGEKLLGISRDVFVRTAFLSQPAIDVTSCPNLEERILSLLSAGEEAVSYSATDKTIAQWQKGIKSQLTDAEQQSVLLENTLSQLSDAETRASAARNRLKRLEQSEGQCRQVLARWDAQQQLEQGRRYRQAQSNLAQAQQRLSQAKAPFVRRGVKPPTLDTLLNLQGECASLKKSSPGYIQAQLEQTEAQLHQAEQALCSTPFQGCTSQQAREQSRQDAHALSAARSARNLDRWLLLLGWMLGAALCLGCLLFSQLTAPWPVIGLGLLALSGGGVTLLAGLRQSRRKGRIALVAASYHTAEPAEILALGEAYALQWEGAQQLSRQLEELRKSAAAQADREYKRQKKLFWAVSLFAPAPHTLAEAEETILCTIRQLEELHSAEQALRSARLLLNAAAQQGMGSPEPAAPLEPVTQGQRDEAAEKIAAIQAQMKNCRHQQSMALGAFQTLGDPDQLRQQRQDLQPTLDKLEEREQACALARSLLAQANEDVAERFSPQLNRLAGEYAAALTGRRYRQVTLTRDFTARTTAPGQLQELPTSLLSSGTSDQIYLAVRLALCQLVLQDHGNTPLVLDDALNRFDNQRLAEALKVLDGLGRQVILFTCTGREEGLRPQN